MNDRELAIAEAHNNNAADRYFEARPHLKNDIGERVYTAAFYAGFEAATENHARELRAYEATVANLEQRIRELEVELSPTIACDDCGSETPDPWHSSKNNNRHHHRCDACHTAALEAQKVPEGFVMVPAEPTDEMISSGCDAANAYRVDMCRAWTAMLLASPEVDSND